MVIYAYLTNVYQNKVYQTRKRRTAEWQIIIQIRKAKVIFYPNFSQSSIFPTTNNQDDSTEKKKAKKNGKSFIFSHKTIYIFPKTMSMSYSRLFLLNMYNWIPLPDNEQHMGIFYYYYFLLFFFLGKNDTISIIHTCLIHLNIFLDRNIKRHKEENRRKTYFLFTLFCLPLWPRNLRYYLMIL